MSSDPASAPFGVGLAGLLAFLLVSALIWCFVGLSRTARYGAQAWAGFWRRPGVPLGVASLALCASLGVFGWALASAVEASSPILLMIGLPGSSLAAFALPWASVLSLSWGGYMLVFGAEKPERHTAYAIHLWIVLTVGLLAVLLLASYGLLIPDLI